MAFDFSKLNFFSRLNARARVFFLLAGLIGMVFLVYLGTRLLSGGSDTTGPSRVASAPAGLQSVPGSQQTVEYQRALEDANARNARQAQMSGNSAVPTLINYGGGVQSSNTSCIICSDQSANVKYDLDDWVKQGKVTPDVATALQQLADKNVSVDEYAAALDQLVKEGKLTPEQARELLEQYKKQHTNALLQDSAKMMDDLIKSGALPIDVANQLLAAQKNNMSPAEYAALLQELVREGKISPAVAQQLLAQYTQQRAKEITMKSITSLRKMARAGQLTPDVENALIDLENNMVPVDIYADTLKQYLSAGKLTPIVANKILDEFKSQKAAIGPTASINQMLQKAEAAAYGEIADLIKAGKMPQDVGAQLTVMIQKNVSLDDYKAAVNQFVQQNKISPDIGKLKIADYQAVKGFREMAQRLGALQGNNASIATYADELKRAVQAGILTPEQAAQLMQEYQAMLAKGGATGAPSNVAMTEAFAALQQRAEQGAAEPVVSANQFAAAETQAQVESAQDREARIASLISTMSGQAQQLISSWQPPTMEYKAGASEFGGPTKPGASTSTSESAGANGSSSGATSGIPLIKAGTILFAVLDTAANSDYPDSPLMATIVDGKYKGAKLLGKLAITKGVSGQMDRVSLNFTMMNSDDWTKSKTVTAYGIDPDTARSVMASQVDYHYIKRFGAIMATSFLQGYSSAITQAGTSTTGIFGTSTTHNNLGPSQKIAVGLGQIGQTLGSVAQNYVNTPPTVRVDSGIGLGILFMADVS